MLKVHKHIRIIYRWNNKSFKKYTAFWFDNKNLIFVLSVQVKHFFQLKLSTIKH